MYDMIINSSDITTFFLQEKQLRKLMRINIPYKTNVFVDINKRVVFENKFLFNRFFFFYRILNLYIFIKLGSSFRMYKIVIYIYI